MLEKKIVGIWSELREKKPLIHCITNPISINDCANIVLAAGGRPIMAEHPGEAAEITRAADALAVNLGNITDARMESIRISGFAAAEKGINSIIDIVGTACSSLRLEYAHKYIQDIRPSVIKGNISELRALGGLDNSACGIDAGEKDMMLDAGDIIPWLSDMSETLGSVILASGKTDYITDGSCAYAIHNGSPRMAAVTGTGCMLNVLTASMLAVTEPVYAALTAAAVFGLCGELADREQGIGSYHIELIDMISVIDEKRIMDGIKVERIR